MTQREIAETINQQLNWAGLPVRWSWGIHALKALPPKDGMRGGLQFAVNGAKHKGHVRVWLTGGDDYTIELGTLRGSFNVSYSVDGIYCDELATTIDGMVET